MLFRAITINDMPAIAEKMALIEKPVSVHWFGNIFLWQDYFETSFCIQDGFLFLRSRVFDGKSWGYLCPVGDGDPEVAMKLLRDEARANNEPLVIFSMCEKCQHFDDFVLLHNRSFQDYIYSAESLRTLSGKKLQPKRNHVNKFLKNYPNVQVRTLTAADCEAIKDLTLRWAQGREYPEGELMLLKRLSENFEALSPIIHGLVAYDGDKAVAFTFGGRINADTFDVMMEKADTEYEGAFAFINQALAKSLPPEIEFIDREEDLGLQGLRKAKLSYHPIELRGYPTGVERNSCMGQMFTLLKECFGDEDEFITKYLFYFSKPENRVLLHKEDDPCCLMAMFNVHLFHTANLGKVAYLYALAVKKEFRGQGLAVEVIFQSLEKAKEMGCIAAFTIQANKKFNAWQHVFGFGDYMQEPIRLIAPDDFDFGTGNPEEDIAICRILDVEEYLRIYARLNPNVEAEFNVDDMMFTENRGLYKISNGTVTKLPYNRNAKTLQIGLLSSKFSISDAEFRT